MASCHALVDIWKWEMTLGRGVTLSNNLAESVNRQDRADPALWLAAKLARWGHFTRFGEGGEVGGESYLNAFRIPR